MEDDRWLGSLRNAARDALERRTPQTYLTPRSCGDPATLGDVAHQALGAVDVEVVHDEMPLSRRSRPVLMADHPDQIHVVLST